MVDSKRTDVENHREQLSRRIGDGGGCTEAWSTAENHREQSTSRRSVLGSIATGAAITPTLMDAAGATRRTGTALDSEMVASAFDEFATDLLVQLDEASLFENAEVSPAGLTDAKIIESLLGQFTDDGEGLWVGQIPIGPDAESVTHIQFTRHVDESAGLTDGESRLSIVLDPPRTDPYAVLTPRGNRRFATGEAGTALRSSDGVLSTRSFGVEPEGCIFSHCNFWASSNDAGCVHMKFYCTGCACSTEVIGSCQNCSVDDNLYCNTYMEPCNLCSTC